jgi:hypothetical protein
MNSGPPRPQKGNARAKRVLDAGYYGTDYRGNAAPIQRKIAHAGKRGNAKEWDGRIVLARKSLCWQGLFHSANRPVKCARGQAMPCFSGHASPQKRRKKRSS